MPRKNDAEQRMKEAQKALAETRDWVQQSLAVIRGMATASK